MLRLAAFATLLGLAPAKPLEGSSIPHSRAKGAARDWDTAEAMAKEFVASLNLTEKSDVVTGKMALGYLSCVGNILPIDRLGFPGMCFQDGPNAVNIADLVSVFPAGLTAAASWDRSLIYERGMALGAEFRAKGVHVALSPTAGPIGRQQLGGRNWEGFSPDPYLTGVAMQAAISGIQSQGVQACAKHVVGNEQETQRQFSISSNGTRIEAISVNIDDRTMHELYLWPFADAIKAGATSIMCSYNRVNGTYACENSKLLNGLLREELGFKGYVISDWFATHSGVKSINAGLDLNMPGAYDQTTIPTGESYWGSNITTIVKNGSVKEEKIDEMIQRILTPYFYLGQDKADYPTVDTTLMYSFAAWTNVLDILPLPAPAIRDVRGNHASLIRKLGAQATVLLKNVNGTLPLKKPLNIGVFGNDAADPSDGLVFTKQFEIGTLDIGAGAGSGRHSYLVSPIEAIKARAKKYGARVQHIFRNSVVANNDFSSIYPIPDVCLVFLNSFAGENIDRVSIEADFNSTLVVQNVARKCPNTIVITHSAGVVLTPWANNPNITAILAAHLPGQESGNSIVDVLWGDVNPSGKLPYSIAKKASDYLIPIVNLTESEVTSPTAWETNFDEGLLIDYRHLDASKIEPEYEFGFGLSYTTFSMGRSLTVKQMTSKYSAKPDTSDGPQPGGYSDLWEPILKASVTVKNTGSVYGGTVPQLYISLPSDSTPDGTPVQVLRGFEKVFLKPGETKTVEFELLRRDISYWDIISQSWVIPKGTMALKSGFSSRDIKVIKKFKLRPVKG